MLGQRWASVVDGGLTLSQHWVNVSCLLGEYRPVPSKHGSMCCACYMSCTSDIHDILCADHEQTSLSPYQIAKIKDHTHQNNVKDVSFLTSVISMFVTH